MRELPIYRAIISESKDGIKITSLVESPALMVDAIKLSESYSIKLAIEEEQRIIIAPALIPDLPIYRNVNGKEFYILFDKPTIEQIALKFHQESRANSVDINHSQTLIPGVTFFESVVSNSKRFSNPKGFEQLPEGTFFLSGKVLNDEVWNDIKLGKINGISIDGLFDLDPMQSIDEDTANAIIFDLLK